MINKNQTSQIKLLAKFFRGLGDKNRLKTLMLLSNNPMSVSELIDELNLPQSTVSSHLKCLRDCNLVKYKQESRKYIYSIASSKIADIINIAEDLLKEIYEEIYACVNYNEE